MTEPDQKLFPKLTPEQIESLRPYGEEAEFAPDDLLFAEGSPCTDLFILLSGRVKVTRKTGDEETTLAIHEPGEFTGEISMLGGGASIATGKAMEPTRTLKIPMNALSRVFVDHKDIEALIVPAMAARLPEADAQLMQREKLAALGKLSAGLAHELNNPAAAAARAAAQLEGVILRQISQAICLSGGCGDEAAEKIEKMLRQAHGGATADLGALERSDRQNDIAEWLEARGVQDSWQLAPNLVDAGITVGNLDQFAALLPPESVGKHAAWLAMTVSSLSLVSQIELSTARISELVKAIKAFTYMDQSPLQDVNIHEGLDATLTILGHKLANVKVIREYDPDLPTVAGRGGELNQVWSNIVDNAIDAMQSRGELTISTRCENDMALVEIADTGAGIPPDVQPHIFEPFFTTKGIGKGTGLGLDTVYRIVVSEHRGDITVRSEPGKTVFQVRLPVSGGSVK